MASPNTTPRTLSRIENLPTELVQQIARYLIRPDYYRDHNDPHLDTRFKYISDGLLELRTTSAILKSKTEHVFRRLFTVKVVAFDRYSLFNLVKLSRSPTCSPLLRELVFLDPWDRQYEEQLEDDRRKLWRLEESALDVVWSDPTLKSLESKHAPETALLITALKGLSKLKTVIISESMQPAYPASVRRSCLARHPPSMILLAALVGGTKLEHVVMSSCSTGDFDGVKPRIFAGHLNDMTTLSTLKTLDLNLTICNRGAKFITGLGGLLTRTKALRTLSITLDTASVIRSLPYEFSETYQISGGLCMHVVFPRLERFTLRGCYVFTSNITTFLSNHKHSLSRLCIVDCNIIGSWAEALSAMLESKIMRRLYLRQLGEDWQRVEFPKTCRTYETDVDGDWVDVSRNPHVASVESHQEWRSSLDAIIQDLRVLDAVVDPSAPDALIWLSEE